MKRRSRKQFFSLIFVPDQEQDPKSISMSYGTGRFLLVVIVLLSIHLIMGGVGYYRVFQLEKTSQTLQEENLELKARNKKIDDIARQLQAIKMTDEKIRRAFGSTLGVQEDGATSAMPPTTRANRATQSSSRGEGRPLQTSADPTQTSRYLVADERSDYYDPDFLPNRLPVEGYLTTRFQKGGWFEGRSHYGIDIAATRGTPIRAAGQGVVLLADWTPDFGNVVIISHGNGFYTYYAHALRLLVTQGTKVRRGQQIALLGSSGRSSAPHLHFEIWRDGVPIDPEQFIIALQSKENQSGP